QVSPAHVALLTACGTLCVAGGVVSILTGTPSARRVIHRSEAPWHCWGAALGMLVLGGRGLVGLAICPRGCHSPPRRPPGRPGARGGQRGTTLGVMRGFWHSRG